MVTIGLLNCVEAAFEKTVAILYHDHWNLLDTFLDQNRTLRFYPSSVR